MNELKNVHYTGTELLWLESGFPEKEFWPEGTKYDYSKEMKEALSKAVRFEDIERAVVFMHKINNGKFLFRSGESYYLDPKLVEVVTLESLPPKYLARIVEPREEQKESQDVRITSAANAIMFLSEYIHGINNGKRADLIDLSLQNAKDHFERLNNPVTK